MNLYFSTILAVLLLVSCGEQPEKLNVMEELNRTIREGVEIDSTPRVTGIGGIFFISDDPKASKEWYAQNLGLKVNEWGSSFESRNVNRPVEINYLQWSPFEKGSEYLVPSNKEFMINYRVHFRRFISEIKSEWGYHLGRNSYIRLW